MRATSHPNPSRPMTPRRVPTWRRSFALAAALAFATAWFAVASPAAHAESGAHRQPPPPPAHTDLLPDDSDA